MKITPRELTELAEFFELRGFQAGLLHCCRHEHRARHLAFEFSWRESSIKGQNMTFTMAPLNAAGAPSTVTVIGSPITGQTNPDGTPVPSKATLSNVTYTSSDPTVGTVAVDPATPNGAIITAVANPPAGTTASFTLTETATATELDGTTTEVITGVATIILSASVVPPAPAAALTFTFGVPA
jgi:hypothetical protein